VNIVHGKAGLVAERTDDGAVAADAEAIRSNADESITLIESAGAIVERSPRSRS
jgi:hypothetical protein